MPRRRKISENLYLVIESELELMEKLLGSTADMAYRGNGMPDEARNAYLQLSELIPKYGKIVLNDVRQNRLD